MGETAAFGVFCRIIQGELRAGFHIRACREGPVSRRVHRRAHNRKK